MYNVNIPSQGYPPNGKQMRPSTPLLSLFLNLQLSVGMGNTMPKKFCQIFFKYIVVLQSMVK
jgi:hypothetical protein